MDIRNILNKDNINLQNCESEPIHIPGSIQEHGFLLGVDIETQLITYCSDNVRHYLKLTPEQVLNKSVLDLCSPGQETQLNHIFSDKEFDQAKPFVFFFNDIDYNTKSFISGKTVVLEFEPFPNGNLTLPDLYKQTQQFVSHLEGAHNLQQLCESIADETRAITGYDRVMIYRFDKDYNGKIVAEAKREDLLPLLGHHYPHTDIPVQARALYLKNMLRMIADVDYTPVPLLTILTESEAKQLDLSMSILRSVSPIHIEYLKNMGVKATLTISLVQDNRLWGMITCHHYTVKNIPYYTRLSALLQGYFFISQIRVRETADEYNAAKAIDENMHTLLDIMAVNDNFIENHYKHPLLKACTDAEGIVIILNEKIYKDGRVPNDGYLLRLITWLKGHAPKGHFITNKLIDVYPEAIDLRDNAAGVVYHTLDSDRHNCVIWLRPEIQKTINWAGNPSKAVLMDNSGARLSPRKSFELWEEIVKYQSKEWTRPELTAATRLAYSLQKQAYLWNIRREEEKYRQLALKLEAANAELENFNWISAHDLKEPLRKIQLFASRMLYSEISRDTYETSLLRIQNATARIQLLLDSMLSFATMSKNKEAFQQVNLNFIIQKVMEKCRKQILAANAVINSEELPILNALPLQIEQLFIQLVSNALKFSKKDTPLILNINHYTSGNQHVISFADNGIGFNNKYAELIFKIFQSLDKDNENTGVGIGLSLCRKIMSNHDGMIKGEGISRKGAIFTVYFPL
jgi:light-regulated signal transduction histidine kinase (bacteriophytochrome)